MRPDSKLTVDQTSDRIQLLSVGRTVILFGAYFKDRYLSLPSPNQRFPASLLLPFNLVKIAQGKVFCQLNKIPLS